MSVVLAGLLLNLVPGHEMLFVMTSARSSTASLTDKIVEDWVLFDSYGLFQQLGLVPSRQELLTAAGGDRR